MAHLGNLLRLPFLQLALWAALFAVAGCENTREAAVLDGAAAPTEHDAGPDGGDPCVLAEEAFQIFLGEHRGCSTDADCTTVGDCGPHITHEPVNMSSAAEARRLQLLTCERGYDGPTDAAKCEAGQCVRVVEGGKCCGCIVEEVNEADYYVRYEDKPGTSLSLNATGLSGSPIELLADKVPAGTEQHIYHAVEGTGGHVMPSNFFGTFEANVEGHVLYEGVVNGDWVESFLEGTRRYTLTVTTERTR